MGGGNQRLDDFARLLSGRIDELRPKSLNMDREAFEAFAEHVPAVIWTADRCGRVTYFNAAFTALTGATGTDYLPMFHPDDAERSRDAWRTHVATSRQAYTNSARLRIRGGDYHWITTRAMPVLSHSGELSFWVGASTVLGSAPGLRIASG